MLRDTEPATAVTRIDFEHYRDDVRSEDNIQITHVSPMKAPKPPTTGHPMLTLTSVSQVVAGHLIPTYLVKRAPRGGRTSTAPTGFQTIQGVQCLPWGSSPFPGR